MKKIQKPLSKELPPVKIYLDDLKQIYEILKEKVKSIEITTEDYEVDDINQLKNLDSKKLNYLSMECSDPHITIEFDSSSASIYFAEDSTYNRGILSEIEEILTKRRVFLGRFLASNWAFGLNGMFVGFFFFAMVSIIRSNFMSAGWLFLALLLLFCILMVLQFRFALRGYSTIVLSERRELVSFWKRNSDQILVAIIAAIIGSLITVAALWIFNLP